MERKDGLPDDRQQNLQDQHSMGVAPRQPIFDRARDQAQAHQGLGPTGRFGGDRPAEEGDSPLAEFDGRDRLPGVTATRTEPYWDQPLATGIVLRAPAGRRLTTLAEAGAFLSGGEGSLPHSAALQSVAQALADAAQSGAQGDIETVTYMLEQYLAAMRLA